MDRTSTLEQPAGDDDVQDVLRQVGRLVAHEDDGQRLFDGVVKALGRTTGADAAWLIHFDSHASITVLGVWSTRELSLPVGTRQAITDELRGFREGGRSYRVDLAELDPASPFGLEARRLDIASAVGVPVWLAGQVWALAVVAVFEPGGFPADTETRMTRFIEPVTAALANALARAKLEEWQSEQAALRRLAQLTAAGLGPDELLRALVDEASALLDGRAVILARLEEDRRNGVVVAASHDQVAVGLRFSAEGDEPAAGILGSGRPVRLDDRARAPDGKVSDELNALAVVTAPIELDGQLWGILAAVPTDRLLPVGTEKCLSALVEIAFTALSSARTRGELQRLADEQAALLRVSQLVSNRADENELFAAVAAEAAALVGHEGTIFARFDGPRTLTVIATRGSPVEVGLSLAVPLDHSGAVSEVIRTHQPARRDDYQTPSAPDLFCPENGLGSSVLVPIIVDGRLWGLLGSVAEGRRLPTETEDRLQHLGELVAVSIANSQARAEIQLLADEQSALLRVAELVAQGARERDLFGAVAIEAAGLMNNEATMLVRHDGNRKFTVLAASGESAAFGTTFSVPVEHGGALSEMLRTGRAARQDSDAETAGLLSSKGGREVGSSVCVPIVVEDTLWGCISTRTQGQQLPRNTEARLQKFGELVAAAIANNQARTEVVQLADEQAALRRAAELVAREASLQEVFSGIAVEASRLLGTGTALLRFEPDGYAEVVAAHDGLAQLGLRIRTTDAYIGQMFAAGQAARLADYSDTGFAAAVEDLGLQPGTAVPITVEGRIWGALKTSPSGAVLRPGAETNVLTRVADKLEKFAALAAAAIANAENRAQLTASRARIVATADEARRRLQRDVHDGAQQRLVQTMLILKLARDAVDSGEPPGELVKEALVHAERATAELRDLVHGILPASLSRRGLRSGIESLIADLSMPVELNFAAPRLPAGTELTAYFVVAEALTNVVKHARATRAYVGVGFRAGRVTIEVSDNGTGGADPARGSGLTGLLDRVQTAEGELTITSPAGGGTTLQTSLPVK